MSTDGQRLALQFIIDDVPEEDMSRLLLRARRQAVKGLREIAGPDRELDEASVLMERLTDAHFGTWLARYSAFCYPPGQVPPPSPEPLDP